MLEMSSQVAFPFRSTSFNTYGNNSAISDIFFRELEVKWFKNKLDRCKKEFRRKECEDCGVVHARPRWCKDRFCPKCAKYLSRRARSAIQVIVKERG